MSYSVFSVKKFVDFRLIDVVWKGVLTLSSNDLKSNNHLMFE